jgi:hypothetical protein
MRRPNEAAARIAEIEALNGPNVLTTELHGRALNAIGNLRTDSPILAALDKTPIDPTVPYHSVIPLIGGVANTDGVVEYRSSHLHGAVSECIVAGTHLSQEAPESDARAATDPPGAPGGESGTVGGGNAVRRDGWASLRSTHPTADLPGSPLSPQPARAGAARPPRSPPQGRRRAPENWVQYS